MVIDTSAIMAILRDEPEAVDFLSKIRADRRPIISSVTLVELEIVCVRRVGPESLSQLRRFLERFDLKIVPFDEVQAAVAVDAFLKFGKGRHKARLNFGDCMTYALAKQTGEPLLFKGNDFNQTDLLLA